MSIFDPKNKWTLVSQDDATTIEGQFEAQNVVESVSGEWADQGTFGLIQPILQFVGGELDKVTLEVLAFAPFDPIFKSAGALVGIKEDQFDIKDLVDTIKGLPRADPDLGRPHVYLFSHGSQLEVQCIVKTVGGIRYQSLRPAGGEMRGVLFSMELWRYEPPPALTGATAAESLVTPAREGETYEHIAARVHNDPDLGEALRRRNPERRTLTKGDLVHVPPARTLRRESLPLTPQSLFFRTGEAQRSLILDAYALHGEPEFSHVVLEDY